MVLLKVVHPLKICQYTKCHGPTLIGASFSSTSEVWTSAIFEWLKVRDYKVRRRGHLRWHDLPTEFHKIYQLVQKLLGGWHTDRRTGDLISLTFLFEESRLKITVLPMDNFSGTYYITDCRGRVVSIPDSYSGGLWFFVVLFSPSIQMLG
jgi:hypothetical protein